MSTIVEKQVKMTLCENPIPIRYEEVPAYTKEDYEARMRRLIECSKSRGYTHLVIYGDREHWSNLCYFTGFDPRFEEAVLLIEIGKTPKILLGNESMGYASLIPVEVERVLFQAFGLMGQPGDESATLHQIFLDSGFNKESRVGVIGWKTYRQVDFCAGYNSVLDVPSYLVETLSLITGRMALENAVDLLADNTNGLKHHLSAKEVVNFELQGTRASRKIYQVIRGLHEGMTEIEASALLEMDGEPTCTHPNMNFGDFNVGLGLRSPTYHQALKLGDSVGAGIGYRGSLVHKSGLYIRSEKDLPAEKSHYLSGFLKPYFACVAAWYEAVRIGAVCGDIYQLVEDMLGMKKFGMVLNPGHYIHTDEWTNSPFQPNSKTQIASGVGIQCDFTATFQNPFLSAHVEDGLVVADQALRDEVKALSPSCWERVQARQTFMREVLGIQIADEVLPMSDLCGVCFPYLADSSVVLAKE